MLSIRLKSLYFALACVLGFGCMARGVVAQEVSTDHCTNVATNGSLVLNGVVRTYVLYVPCRFRAHESALVVAMHGRSATGAGFEASSHLDDKANRERFMIRTPRSLEKRWQRRQDGAFRAPCRVGRFIAGNRACG